MGPHLRIVAGEFRIGGLVLGIPSVVVAGVLTYAAIDLGSTPLPPPDKSPYLDIGTYGLVGLLNNGAKGVVAILGPPLELAAEAVIWIIVWLAIASFVIALFAVLAYFTGRGIGRRATWARIVGIVLTAGLLFVSIGVMEALPLKLALFGSIPVGLSLYTLWVLGWRFA